MKILLVWPSAEMSIYDVAVGIREGFIAEGHEVLDYRLYRRYKLVQQGFEAFRPEGETNFFDPNVLCLHASEGLPQLALLHNPDWIFVVCGMGLHPDALEACRRAGYKIACWFTEAPYNTDTDSELYLTKFCDIAFVNDKYSVPVFQDILDKENKGGQAFYLPHAYRPLVHTTGDETQDIDVIFIGSGFEERQILLEGIDWTGINIKILGMWFGINDQNYLHKYLVNETVDNKDTASWYRRSKIVLNPHRQANVSAYSANPRTYEAAACGAFQISDYREEIKDLFGESIPTYEPGVSWQLETLIRQALNDKAYRQRLAKESNERVRPFTFNYRAKEIGCILESVQPISLVSN